MSNSIAFTDLFNRADSIELGTQWDSGYGTTNTLQIVSNAVRAIALGNDSLETVNAHPTLADSWIEVTFGAFTGAVAGVAKPILRSAASPTLTFIVADLRRNSFYTSAFEVFVDGVATNLGSENATTWLAGDVARFEVTGSDYRLYRNNLLLLSVTDATLTSGRIGLVIYEDTGGNLANVTIDTVQGGPIRKFLLVR